MPKILKIQTTANKGEWAEFYAHLKIICDQTIPKGNHNLEPDPNTIYSVLAIFKQNFEYILNQKQGTIIIHDKNSKTKKALKILPIKNKLQNIFNEILAGKGLGSFTIKEGVILSEYLNLPVTNSQKIKSDIDLKIKDPNTQTDQKLGFSIKSKITAEATLVNASLQTRFKFKINNIAPEIIQTVNSIEGISKIRKRIDFLNVNNIKITSVGCKSDKFKTNLTHFDSIFDILLGQMMLIAYQDQKIRVTNNLGADLIKAKSIKDLLSISQSKLFQEYLENHNLNSHIFTNKLKDFLIAFALGMEPVKEWSGIDDVNGGIIWIKKDGSIVCHHLFERKELKEYLINNTFFETPSTSRHQFGYIYEENSQYFFDLCLQIRFK